MQDTSVYEKGWFGDIEVWYYPKGIANNLSLKTLKNRHNITYDSRDRGGIFKVHIKDDLVEFVPHESGLHYLNLKDQHESGVTLVTTIKDNFEGYTKHEVERTVKAWELQIMLGHPSQKDFEGMVCANLIANCPVTENHISICLTPRM